MTEKERYHVPMVLHMCHVTWYYWARVNLSRVYIARDMSTFLVFLLSDISILICVYYVHVYSFYYDDISRSPLVYVLRVDIYIKAA